MEHLCPALSSLVTPPAATGQLYHMHPWQCLEEFSGLLFLANEHEQCSHIHTVGWIGTLKYGLRTTLPEWRSCSHLVQKNQPWFWSLSTCFHLYRIRFSTNHLTCALRMWQFSSHLPSMISVDRSGRMLHTFDAFEVKIHHGVFASES